MYGKTTIGRMYLKTGPEQFGRICGYIVREGDWTVGFAPLPRLPGSYLNKEYTWGEDEFAVHPDEWLALNVETGEPISVYKAPVCIGSYIRGSRSLEDIVTGSYVDFDLCEPIRSNIPVGDMPEDYRNDLENAIEFPRPEWKYIMKLKNTRIVRWYPDGAGNAARSVIDTSEWDNVPCALLDGCVLMKGYVNVINNRAFGFLRDDDGHSLIDLSNGEIVYQTVNEGDARIASLIIAARISIKEPLCEGLIPTSVSQDYLQLLKKLKMDYFDVAMRGDTRFKFKIR